MVAGEVANVTKTGVPLDDRTGLADGLDVTVGCGKGEERIKDDS